MNKKELIKWIKESEQIPDPQKEVSIRFTCCDQDFPKKDRVEVKEKFKAINKALSKIQKSRDKTEKAKLLIDAWEKGEKGEKGEKEAGELFGPAWKKFGDQRMLFTLTGDGKQLRGWYAVPGSMKYDHVDSCGRGMLIEVYGDPEKMKEILPVFLGILYRYEIPIPNGCKIYKYYS